MHQLKFNTGVGGGRERERKACLPQTNQTNPSEFPGDFREGDRRCFPAVCRCVFPPQSSGGIPVPADPGAPVAAVRADDDDGDQRQVHGDRAASGRPCQNKAAAPGEIDTRRVKVKTRIRSCCFFFNWCIDQ